MDIILGLIIGLVFFIATIKAYTVGLKHGRQLGNGNVPTVRINPVKTIVQASESAKQKKEEERIETEMSDMMGATKESMLEAIKKEAR